MFLENYAVSHYMENNLPLIGHLDQKPSEINVGNGQLCCNFFSTAPPNSMLQLCQEL